MTVRVPSFANASNCQVVRLSTAGGKDNFAWPGVDERSDIPARFVDCRPGFLSVLVDARRIPELAAEIWQHRLNDARVNRGGSAVIQIDFMHN
jgi:hypothetical protein